MLGLRQWLILHVERKNICFAGQALPKRVYQK
jgi:hypothetical protein